MAIWVPFHEALSESDHSPTCHPPFPPLSPPGEERLQGRQMPLVPCSPCGDGETPRVWDHALSPSSASPGSEFLSLESIRGGRRGGCPGDVFQCCTGLAVYAGVSALPLKHQCVPSCWWVMPWRDNSGECWGRSLRSHRWTWPDIMPHLLLLLLLCSPPQS